MSNKIPSFTAGKAEFVFQMPFAQTDHINKKIYLLEQDGCQPIYTPAATYDGFCRCSFLWASDWLQSVGDYPLSPAHEYHDFSLLVYIITALFEIPLKHLDTA